MYLYCVVYTELGAQMHKSTHVHPLPTQSNQFFFIEFFFVLAVRIDDIQLYNRNNGVVTR